MCDFKIGNFVEIIEPDCSYVSYDKMFEIVGFKNKKFNGLWKTGERGVIFSVNPHTTFDNILLSIEHEDGRQCLIDYVGVKLISNRKPFKLNR